MKESNHSAGFCCLHYKYTVFTDQVTKQTDMLEVLQEVDNPLISRVFHIEYSKCRPKGIVIPYILNHI